MKHRCAGALTANSNRGRWPNPPPLLTVVLANLTCTPHLCTSGPTVMIGRRRKSPDGRPTRSKQFQESGGELEHRRGRRRRPHPHQAADSGEGSHKGSSNLRPAVGRPPRSSPHGPRGKRRRDAKDEREGRLEPAEKTLNLRRIVDRRSRLTRDQRLPKWTTLGPLDGTASARAAWLIRLGDTFHCRPVSVITVTVVLL